VQNLRRLVVLACLAALVLSGTAMAGTLVVGAPANSNNCLPFGCAYRGQYQQVYANSLFSGPITITGLEFYNTQWDSGATAMSTGTFAISLSTTTAGWNGLSATMADNIGGDNTLVFDGSLVQPWTFGDTLSIVFSTPFTYTPGTDANLLLDVVSTDMSNSDGNLFFDANGGNAFFGRTYGSGVEPGYGLVTGFSTDPIGTPEPASFALLLAGLAGLTLLRKRVS